VDEREMRLPRETFAKRMISAKMLMLGLRPMVSGSAEKALDGLKEIVSDIEKACTLFL
jgi:hypothetical protein